MVFIRSFMWICHSSPTQFVFCRKYIIIFNKRNNNSFYSQDNSIPTPANAR